MARTSPMLTSGVRQLAVNILTKSWLKTPRLTIFMGGMRSPSWNISVKAGDIEDGTAPPISERCAKHQP